MFGKPQWFRPKAIGWGLIPISLQGWLYAGGWAGAISLPFLLLISRHQPVEAMAWLVLGIGGLTCDVWHILRGFRAPEKAANSVVATTPKRDDNVLYIMDSQPGMAGATRNYNLQVRR